MACLVTERCITMLKVFSWTNGASIDACKHHIGQQNMRLARTNMLAARRSAWQAEKRLQCSSSHHPGNHSVPEQCKRDLPRHTMRRAVRNFWLGRRALIPTLHMGAFRTWAPARAPSRARRASAVVSKTTNYFLKPQMCVAEKPFPSKPGDALSSAN